MVEGVVARGERGQAVQALDQLERRDVLGGPARGDDAPAAQHRRDHPERHADAEAVRVDLRRRDVVEEAAVLVVGEQERGARISGDARSASMTCCCRRIPIETSVGGCSSSWSLELGMTHETAGSVPAAQSLQVVLLRGERPRVVRPAAPEHRRVVGLGREDVVDADEVVDLPRDPGLLEQVEDDRPPRRVEDPEAADGRCS